MQIEIEIQRPLATLLVFAGMFGFIGWNVSNASNESPPKKDITALLIAAGGTEELSQEDVHAAEQSVRRARQRRAVLERKEEILRQQLTALNRANELVKLEDNTAIKDEIRATAQKLNYLLQDKREAESYMLVSLKQVWEAQEIGGMFGMGEGQIDGLLWPVEPTYGLSATFLDEGYEDVFGITHEAIDIPTLQGTEIRAAADGTVQKVADNGLGYSYIVLRHRGGATLYGHVSEFLVEEGANVRRGDSIALSGGRPGSKGAGSLTTGPHLHFEVIEGGVRIDPLKRLVSQGITQ